MPLKVRFRHAAAQRVLELPDRSMAKPLIIGRGSDADLRLPIEAIAPQHAALYLREGNWVIQRMAGVLTRGGKALDGETRLRSGDIVALGDGPAAPTIEIDPTSPVSASPSPVSSAESIRAPFQAAPAPAPAPAPVRARPAQPTREAIAPPSPNEDEAQFASPEAGDTIEWDPQTPVPATTEFYVPKQRTPILAITIAVLLGGGAIVAMGVFAYQKTRHPRVVVIYPTGAPAPAPAPISTKRPLFDLNPDQPSAPPEDARDRTANPSNGDSPAAPASTATPPSAPPPVASNAQENPSAAAPPATMAKEEAPPDPNDTEWAEIRNAHFNVRHQGVAIIKYDEYRRDHPGKFTALLDRYTDDAVNWLYWQRVAQLWARQDDLTAQIRQKKRDIQNQPPGNYHEQLVKELADLQTKDQDTKKLLTDEMGYHGDVPPDLESPRQLKQLEDSRDPAKYVAFSKHVLRYVRNNHGGVWWDGE